MDPPTRSWMQNHGGSPEMTESCSPFGEGRGLCHLRRIGIRAPVPSIADVIHFSKTITLIGKNREVVDCFLSCATGGGNYISRIHARVIRTRETYELLDSSLRGVYVNDVRISGKVVLQEGDTVTFGHPDGKGILPGVRVRQPNSPFYFLFERCHCTFEQMQRLCAERRTSFQESPTSASTGASQLSRLSLGFRNNLTPPEAAQALPMGPPTSTPEARRGCLRLEATALASPLTSAASAFLPVTPSLATRSDGNSVAPGVDSWNRATAGSFPPLGGAESPATSLLLRSTSPDYPVLGEESPVAPEPCPQRRTLEKPHFPLLQESPPSGDSESPEGDGEPETGGDPGSNEPFPPEDSKSGPGVTGPADLRPPLPSPACLKESAAADCEEGFWSGRSNDPAGLPKGLPQATYFLPSKSRDEPGPASTPPGQKELVPDSSGQEEKIREMNFSRSPEETAQLEPPVEKHSVLERQVVEEEGEAMGGDEGTPVWWMEGESPGEEQARSVMEQAVPGADVAASAAHRVPEEIRTSLSGISGSAQNNGSDRMAGDCPSLKEPESPSLPGSVRWGRSDPERARDASPRKSRSWGTPKASDDCAMSSQDSASDGERDMETQPYGDINLLAVGCHTGTRDTDRPELETGSVNREAAGVGLLEAPCAETGAQSLCGKERGLDGVTSECAEGKDTSTKLDGVGYDGLSTRVVLHGLPPVALPAEGPSKEEFDKEGEAESATARQESMSSGDLSEPSGQESVLPAASNPLAVPVLQKGAIPEQPLAAAVLERLEVVPGEGCFCGSLSCNSEIPAEEKGEETAKVERRSECLGPKWDGKDKGQDSNVGGSVPEVDVREDGGHAPLVAGSPEGQPSCESGSEEEMETEYLQGEEDSEEEAEEAGTAGAAGPQQQAAGRDSWPRGLREGPLCAPAKDPPTRCRQEEAAGPLAGTAGRPARQRSPFRGLADYFGEGGIPHSSHSPSTEARCPLQTSKEEVVGKRGPENGSVLARPVGTEEEGERQDGEGPPAVAGGGGAGDAEASSGHAEGGGEGNPSQMGLWDDFHAPRGSPSSNSTHLKCCPEPPLPVDQLEAEPDRSEPEAPGGRLGMNPQGVEVGKPVLCPKASLMEGSAPEEAHEPDVVVDRFASPGPERACQDTTFQEEDVEFGRTPEGPQWEEEKVSLREGAPRAASEKAGAAEESGGGNLLREPQVDSAEVPESCGHGKRNAPVPDSGADEEDSTGRESVQGAQAPGRWRHDWGVAENSDGWGDVSEGSTVQAPCTAAVQGSSIGGQEMSGVLLEQHVGSRSESLDDIEDAAVAEPQSHQAEVAAGGDSTLSVRHGGAAEEGEDPYANRGGLAAVASVHLAAEPPCLAEIHAKCSLKGEAPAGAGELSENASSALEPDGGLASGRSPRQLGVGRLPVPFEAGGRGEEPPGWGGPAGLRSDEEEWTQKTEGQCPAHLCPDVETGRRDGSEGQYEVGSDSSSVGLNEGEEFWDCPGGILQKEEEPEGVYSRKRPLDDKVEVRVSDRGEDSGSPKRPCLQDLHPGRELPFGLSPLAMTAPLLDVRKGDLFGTTKGRFPDRLSDRVTLHMGRLEQHKRDMVAEMVRNYFKKTFCSSEPGNGSGKAAMLALPVEAGEGSESRSAGVPETRGETRQEEPPFSAEDPSSSTWLQASSSDGQPLSAVSPSGCPPREQGDSSESHSPESIWEAYFSQEEHFQTKVCSALESSPPGSPSRSLSVERAPEPSRETLDGFFSDTSNGSAEAAHGGPACKPSDGNSSGGESGGLPEGASDLAEINTLPESSRGASRTPSGTPASSPESRWSLTEEAQPEPDGSVTPGECDALRLQRGDGMLDGADATEEAACIEDSEPGEPPYVNSIAGEKEQDEASRSRMQTEEAASAQRKATDSPCQEMECELSGDPSRASPPWEPCPTLCTWPGAGRSPVAPKGELPDQDHCPEGDHRRGSPSPSRGTSPPPASSDQASSPTGGNAQEGPPLPKWSSAFSNSPAQTETSRLLNGEPFLGSPVGRDSCTGVEDDGPREGRQVKESGRSLSPPPSFRHTVADYAGEGDLGGRLRNDLFRWSPLARSDLTRASQGFPEEGRTSGAAPVSGGLGSLALARSSLACIEAPASAWNQWAGASSASPVFKEEKEWEDSHEPLASLGSCPASSTACLPAIAVPPKPLLQGASAAQPPETWTHPVGSGSRDNPPVRPAKEAEAPWPLDCKPVDSNREGAVCPASPLGPEEGGVLSRRDRPPCGSSAPSQRDFWPGAKGAESSVPSGWASSEQDVVFQLQECQSVLAEISQTLGGAEGLDHSHVEKWRDQVAALQKATQMPQTHIAVVGNTGAGKSCLLNALLDEEAVLPTSAMRACTAVVVEISRAVGGSPYEAEVEFLSHQEWYKELQALLEDMKDKSGHLKRRCPDRKTEAGAAYCRVKAVYGRIDDLEKLENIQDVTQHLGTVQHLSAETAAVFRTKIEKYIDSQTDNLREMKGGEFWPIVKCVRIRVAKSEVLKTGAVLVDLPGIRDSNTARDRAAKEYLKDCHAVWIVASITRAVDDKTAKEMLEANLRRQLLMDGHYGSLAFVCTKTDSFNITDIVRDLKLQDEIQPIEDELRELEGQRMQAEVEKRSLYEQLQQEGEQRPQPISLQRQHDILEKEFKISDLQRKKDAKLRAISLICVEARNRFSKKQILMDFSAGLEEMKRKAAEPEGEEDSDEDSEESRELGRSDLAGLGETQSQLGQLQVFTVSATEYLKLGGKLLRDGQPQVFHDTKDTEIPALKKFAIDTALKHSMVATEKVVRDVACVLGQMVNFLMSQRAEDCSHQAQVQETVQLALQGVLPLLQEPVERSLCDIQHCFGVLIRNSLRKGAAEAKELSEAIVRSWGLPPFSLPHATYRAACCRHGVYTSPSLKNQHVDFNRCLAEPIFRAIAVTWNHVFSFRLVESIQDFGKGVLEKLNSFFRDLERQLSRGVEAIHAVSVQQTEAARARLLSFVLELKDFITREQRKISRLLTPEIKAHMEPAYAACAQMRGKGYFEQMKARMESHIQREKEVIFDSAVRKLQDQLDRLQQTIQARLQSFVQELTRSLKMQLEAVLKPVQKNAKIIPELMNICAKMDKICRRSCVDYILPSPTRTAEDGSLWMEGESPKAQDPASFVVPFLDLRVGAVRLPPVVSIQERCRRPEKARFACAIQKPAAKPHRVLCLPVYLCRTSL
ncbi:uncharacterized protein LOC110084817 isoform X2 [Pogona vitticeps]